VDFSVVGVLRQNTRVAMLGRDTSGRWILIRTDGLQGWVNRYYLYSDFPFTSLSFITNPAQPGTGQPARPEQPMPQFDAMVNTSSLNVRSGPGVQFRAIAVVQGGTDVNVVSRDSNGWVQIQIPGSVTGWVNGRYLTFR
jgi:SH3-like domain-containing protein